MEVCVRSIPTVHFDPFAVAAGAKAPSREVILGAQCGSTPVFEGDRHLTHSEALNAIQDELKYARAERNFEAPCNLMRGRALVQTTNDPQVRFPIQQTNLRGGPRRTDGIPAGEPTDNRGPGLGRGFLHA